MSDQTFADLMNNPEGRAWVESRPPCVQAAIRKCPPGLRYRMKGCGGEYTIYSYYEAEGGVLLKVHRWDCGEYRWTVFGVSQDDLTPLDPDQPNVIGPAS